MGHLIVFQAGLTSMADRAIEASEPLNESTSANGPSAKPPIKRFKLLSQDTLNRRAARDSLSSSVGTRNAAEAELERYLGEAAGACEVPSALEFWLDRQKAFPVIAPFALDLVTCPASQAYVERAFSLCGDMCARKRNRACINLERRVFLKLNSKFIKA
jgi:hypothetical protein